MSVSAVKALCLVLPLVSGLSVPLPAPTLGYVDSSNPPTPAPQTTPPPRLESRQDYLTVVTWKVTGEPSMCGFEDGNMDNYVTCDDAMTCAYQRPNEKYVGMLGCCEEGLKDCIFFSTCINLSQVSATPSLTETPQPLAWYCTDPASPACYTWLYSDMSVTDFGCATEPGATEMYTTARNATTTSDKLLLYDLYLTQVGSEAVDSYLATFSSEHGLNTATNTPTGTNSPSSGESKNKGAIAGGVVGGVAGLALIGAAGFFVRRKMNSKKTQGAEGVEANDGKGPYSSVPELHSPYLANKPQFVSEMGTNETKQQLSEVDGSTPGNRVYEMQETPVKGTEGKNFAAELPADSEFPATR